MAATPSISLFATPKACLRPGHTTMHLYRLVALHAREQTYEQIHYHVISHFPHNLISPHEELMLMKSRGLASLQELDAKSTSVYHVLCTSVWNVREQETLGLICMSESMYEELMLMKSCGFASFRITLYSLIGDFWEA